MGSNPRIEHLTFHGCQRWILKWQQDSESGKSEDGIQSDQCWESSTAFNISPTCEMNSKLNYDLFLDFKLDNSQKERRQESETSKAFLFSRRRIRSQSSDRFYGQNEFKRPIKTPDSEVMPSFQLMESWVDRVPCISPDDIRNYPIPMCYEGNDFACLQDKPRIISPTKLNVYPRKVKKRKPQTASQRKAATLRERRRTEGLKTAFQTLKEKLPTFSYETDLTRLETLKLAATYIGFLSDVLSGQHPQDMTLH